ncbi:MAG: peptidylprolyl isomerase [Bryobacteraceae bacterium]|jgi:peptidyl-prolyl cis-trans isomerase D
MFDLFRSREKNVRWLLGILLGLVALSMVVTLVPSYGGLSRGGNVDQSVIAEIGDEVVTSVQVRQLLAQASRSGVLPRGLEAIYAPRLVNQLIAERATAYEAGRLGMRVSEDQLAVEIQGQLPQLFEGGKFAGTAVYASYLQQINKTIPEFESDLRNLILAQRLEGVALEGMVVSPAQIEEEFRQRNEKIRISYFSLTPDKFKGQVAVSQAELQAYLKQFHSAFMLPETRDLLYFVIDQAKVATATEVPERDLRRAYDEQRDRFRIPERVHVLHILIKTTGKPDKELPALRKRMDDLLKQVKSGADFAALARKNSEDTGSAVKGGDIGWITRGQTVPEFEKAAFSLKPGQTSDVITTTYGFHILRVEQKEAAHLRTFEEVRGDLQKELTGARVVDTMQALGDQLHAALGRSAAEAETLAAANGIKALRADHAGPNDNFPEVGRNAAFNDALTGLPKGAVTPPFSLTPTQLAVVQVLNVYPFRQAELSEVQDRVRQAVIEEKTRRLIGDKALAIQKQLKAGQDFAALAKSVGAELKSTATPFGREGAAEGLGAARQIEAAFSKQPGESAGPFNLPEGTFFVKVIEKLEPDMSQLPAQREQLMNAVKGRIANDRRDLFIEGIVEALTKDKTIRIHADNMKRLLSSFGS